MKRPKTFDCVEMKNAIQAQLSKKREGMSNAEVRTQIQQKIETSNSPVAQLWRILRSRKAALTS
jgi:hypothetical protein